MTVGALQQSSAAAAPTQPTSRAIRVYLLEAKYELPKLLRLPCVRHPQPRLPNDVLCVVRPSFSEQRKGLDIAKYLLATYGAFGVIGIALFSLGVGVAAERGQGWLAVKRASPMPVPAYFFGKYAMTVLFSAVLVVLLSLMGAVFGHVRMPPSQWAMLMLVQILGGIPFCAAGIAVAYLVGPNSAPAIVNAFYLPSAFLSGPVHSGGNASIFPEKLRAVPAAVSLRASRPDCHRHRAGFEVVWTHIGAMVGFAILFTTIAVIAYRRDEGKNLRLIDVTD